MQRRSKEYVMLTLAIVLVVSPAPILAMDGAPARTAVSITFQGQPDMPSMSEAVHWAMTAVAASDHLPVTTSRLLGGGDLYFADSSWTGNPPVPCGVADAVTNLLWVAPNQSVPDEWPPRRPVRIELPEGEPDQVTLMEAGPEWRKYMCEFMHGHFSFSMDDGITLSADKDSLYVVVWSNGPRVWRPWGVFVFGGILEPQYAPFAARPTGVKDSTAAIRTTQLRIERVIGSTPGRLSFDVVLAQPSPARLELFDVQGRRISGREISGLASREQRVSFEGKRVAAGVYWARLAQGRDQVTSRVLVLP